LLVGAVAVSAVAFAATGRALVVCAPGYPSDTEEAQPIMNDLAFALADGAGWPEDGISAAYHSSVEGGVEALSDPRAGLALVPLPFYLEHRASLGLEPWLGVTQAAGPSEVWSLVAKRGVVRAPADLAGWELSGMPGYSPRFVRGVALADWGELPADVQIRFGSRILAVLRGAARGDRVAAVLDTAQTEALDSLSYGPELEVVARSRPLVGTLLCRVGDRLPDEAADELKAAFFGLGESEDGRALLDTLRIAEFGPIDADGLERATRAFEAAGTGAR